MRRCLCGNEGVIAVNTIAIDFAACDGCQTCYKSCFVDVFRWDRDAKRPIVAYPEDCVQCNLCELNCPVAAITVTVDWDKPFPSVLEHGERYPA
jgi:NAD-dependent dihydropyrimidine dehydrogenase PreA subunit